MDININERMSELFFPPVDILFFTRGYFGDMDNVDFPRSGSDYFYKSISCSYQARI